MSVNPGATSQSTIFQVVDDSGVSVSGLVAATMPDIYWVRKGSGVDAVKITLADLTLITSAYSVGGVKEYSGGAAVYRLDPPDAAYATEGEIIIFGEATGKHVICNPIIVKKLSAFDSANDKVTLASATHTGAVIPTVTSLTNAPPDSSGVTTLLSRLTTLRAGYLDVLNNLVSTIWSNVSDSAGVTTLLSRIGGALTITGGKIDVNDKTGFFLDTTEHGAIATQVEMQIINETDGETVLQAITDKIAAVDPSLGDLTLGAIASQVRTELAPELADIVALEARLTAVRAAFLEKLNVSGELANSDAVALYKADISGLATAASIALLNNLSGTDVRTQVDNALIAYDPQTQTEAESDKAEVIAAIPSVAGLATATSQTALLADTADLKSRVPLALVGGKMDSIATIDTSGLQVQLADAEKAKIDFIYNKFTPITSDRAALVLPDASTPGMVVLAVSLRNGNDPVDGKTVEVKMVEQSNVYLDGAYEVDKTYTGVTGQPLTVNDTAVPGVAFIEVFASSRLDGAGYSGIYSVKVAGATRRVWVSDGGGDLHAMPETKPTV